MRLNPTSSPANVVGKGARDVMAVWKELDASSAIGFQSWSNTVRGYKYVQPIKSPLKISFKKWKQIKVLLTTDKSKFRMFSTILSQETAQGALIHHQAQRGLRWKENKNWKPSHPKPIDACFFTRFAQLCPDSFRALHDPRENRALWTLCDQVRKHSSRDYTSPNSPSSWATSWLKNSACSCGPSVVVSDWSASCGRRAEVLEARELDTVYCVKWPEQQEHRLVRSIRLSEVAEPSVRCVHSDEA